MAAVKCHAMLALLGVCDRLTPCTAANGLQTCLSPLGHVTPDTLTHHDLLFKSVNLHLPGGSTSSSLRVQVHLHWCTFCGASPPLYLTPFHSSVVASPGDELGMVWPGILWENDRV